MRKIIANMLFTAMIKTLAVIIIFGQKREYDCLTPEEIESLKRYQAITDIVCPTGEWVDDYSWVQ